MQITEINYIFVSTMVILYQGENTAAANWFLVWFLQEETTGAERWSQCRSAKKTNKLYFLQRLREPGFKSELLTIYLH